MRASSTVFVKASSLVKRDLADISVGSHANQMGGAWQLLDHQRFPACDRGRQTARDGVRQGRCRVKERREVDRQVS
jgi:hypothetical protein